MERFFSVLCFGLIFFLLASLGGSLGATPELPPEPLPAGKLIASLGTSAEGLLGLPQAALEQFKEIGSALAAVKSPGERRIVVSLKLQTLSLIEGGQVVETYPILTGQQGMETPPGEYEVLSKSPATTMSGAIGTPLEYKVENVPWCLFFIGRTYAIHGNYWKPEEYFGKQPTWTGSHGCVGLLPSEAELVYDWADIGTKIVITN